jgi:dUTP pyrophosphatase
MFNQINNIEDLYKKTKELELFLNENQKDIDFNLIYEEYGLDVKQLENDMLKYTPKLDLGFIKLNSDAVDPSYNYDGDSGFDLYSTEEVVLPPFGRALVSTGLAFEIKDGYEIQVRSKSGLALKQGLMVLNSPGTVDNSYTGEVKVILFNVNNHEFVVNKGMKIAQAVLTSVVNGKWVNLVNKKEINKTDRADKGFGSTGI